jgi:hypothetical protein
MNRGAIVPNQPSTPGNGKQSRKILSVTDDQILSDAVSAIDDLDMFCNEAKRALDAGRVSEALIFLGQMRITNARLIALLEAFKPKS